MARMTVGVIGLGMAVAPHAESLLALADRVEVAGCFARDPARRDGFRDRFALPVTDDLDGLFADPEIDALFILTPPGTHLDLVRRAAAAGKHVLLEKPIDTVLQRTRSLVETMAAADRTLAVMLQHRFRGPSRRLAGLVAEGRLGRLLMASVSIPWWRPPSYYATTAGTPGRGTLARDGGGVLMTQGIHALDLFLSLAGPAEEVMAYAVTSPLRPIDTEDIAVAAVRLAGGAVGTVEATTTAQPGWPELITLVGEHGTARLSPSGLSVALGDGTTIAEAGDEASGGGAEPMAFSHSSHQALITDFLDAIDQGRPPVTSGQAAFDVHALIDGLLASAAARAPVAVERL